MDFDPAEEDSHATMSAAGESGASSMDTSEDRVANSNEHTARDISDDHVAGALNLQNGASVWRCDSRASDKDARQTLKPSVMWLPSKIGRPKENSRRSPYEIVHKRSKQSYQTEEEEEIAKVLETFRTERCAKIPSLELCLPVPQVALPPPSRPSSFARPMSHRMQLLLDMPPVGADTQLQHAWNPEDRSFNLYVKEDDPLTLHRHPVAQSSDCIRGKVAYERGLHIFEMTWSARQRGTNAVVGVATGEAPLHCIGYQSLVGSNPHSWGWDLTKNKLMHNSDASATLETYPRLNGRWAESPLAAKAEENFVVPDKFLAILNMDSGELGFAAHGHYFGPAFSGLRGKKLHLIVSAVWGHCEVSMKYIGGIDCSPLPLVALCRHVVRRHAGKEAVERGAARHLRLPATLKDFLEYRE